MKKIYFNLFALLFGAIVISSCAEDVLEPESVENAEQTIAKAVYANRNVTFNHPNGSYARWRINKDFGNSSKVNNSELSRMRIGGKTMFLKLLKNKIGDKGGQYADFNITKGKHYEIFYNVKFTSGFNFGKGGKLPGLAGGAAYTGCRGADARSQGNGWSSRVMWGRKNKNGKTINAFYPYIYHAGMGGRCGEQFRTFSDPIAANKWYTVRMVVKMNTGSKNDGLLAIQINGKYLIYNTNMKWVTKNAGREIDLLMFGVYRGGADSSWAVGADNEIQFDNVKWAKKS
ncbi:MAG: polysaccharide lyase [Bacteroidota bacterium]